MVTEVARQRALPEDRLDDIDVGEMSAPGVGVVEDEDIAGVGVVAVGGANGLHGVGDGAEVQREGQALRDQLAGRAGRARWRSPCCS